MIESIKEFFCCLFEEPYERIMPSVEESMDKIIYVLRQRDYFYYKETGNCYKIGDERNGMLCTDISYKVVGGPEQGMCEVTFSFGITREKRIENLKKELEQLERTDS